MSSRNFCTTAELAAELGDPDLGVIDGSWHLPNTGRLGAVEFPLGHIPGAVYFDIDTIADRDSGLPHMLPQARAAGRGNDRARPRRRHALRRLRRARPVRGGAGLVDASGLRRARRAHPRRRPDEMDRRGAAARDRARRIRSRGPSRRGSTDKFVASLDEVRAALANGSAQVVDARPADRFRGEAPEPRPGLKSGHMPGSLNLPFSEVVEHGRLKSPETLKAIFAAQRSISRKPIITTCGSGVSAAILALAVEEAGGTVEGLYDGSWAEWGGRDDCPVATGARLKALSRAKRFPGAKSKFSRRCGRFSSGGRPADPARRTRVRRARRVRPAVPVLRRRGAGARAVLAPEMRLFKGLRPASVPRAPPRKFLHGVRARSRSPVCPPQGFRPPACRGERTGIDRDSARWGTEPSFCFKEYCAPIFSVVKKMSIGVRASLSLGLSASAKHLPDYGRRASGVARPTRPASSRQGAFGVRRDQIRWSFGPHSSTASALPDIVGRSGTAAPLSLSRSCGPFAQCTDPNRIPKNSWNALQLMPDGQS